MCVPTLSETLLETFWEFYVSTLMTRSVAGLVDCLLQHWQLCGVVFLSENGDLVKACFAVRRQEANTKYAQKYDSKKEIMISQTAFAAKTTQEGT